MFNYSFIVEPSKILSIFVEKGLLFHWKYAIMMLKNNNRMHFYCLFYNIIPIMLSTDAFGCRFLNY